MVKAELLRDADDMLILAKALETGDFAKYTPQLGQFLRLLQDPNYCFQEKHNGDRRIIEKVGNVIRDYNRNGEPAKGLPPSVINALLRHPLHRFVIDGELVTINDVPTFFVFDSLFLGDESLAAKPYSYRESSYHSQFDGFDAAVSPVATARTVDEKMALIVRLKNEDAEGFVAKDMRAQYRPSDRDQRWNYRYKYWKTLDAVVIGDSTKVVDGHKRDSVRIGCYDKNGRLKDICGVTKKSTIPVKPGDVVEVKYLYGTGSLDIVQITMLRKRDDKQPRQCTLSQIVVNKNFKSKAARMNLC